MYWFVNILTHLLYLSQCIVCRRYVGDETYSISDETHNLVKMSPTTGKDDVGDVVGKSNIAFCDVFYGIFCDVFSTVSKLKKVIKQAFFLSHFIKKV